jgi:Penicillinase repressor
MRQFGELEAVIMDRLWDRGKPALVREVLDDLRKDRPLAYTTVMTVMENLHRSPADPAAAQAQLNHSARSAASCCAQAPPHSR